MNKQELFNLLVTIYIVIATIIFFVISYKIHCLNSAQNIIKNWIKECNIYLLSIKDTLNNHTKVLKRKENK